VNPFPDAEDCVTEVVKKSFPNPAAAGVSDPARQKSVGKRVQGRQEAAQLLAIRALAWLAADETLIGQFLAATGASPDEVRARAGDADFHLAILDFLLMEDERVMAFCDAHSLPYTEPQAARGALPGGELPHWT
jgi:hypothetical protein